MRTREVSELLGVSASNVDTDIRKGRLEASKMKNGRNLITIDAFITYIKTYPTMYRHFFENEDVTRVSSLRSLVMKRLMCHRNFAQDVSFSTSVIAETLGVHRSTVAHYVQAGTLKGRRLGDRLWCCYGHDVLQFVAQEESRYYGVCATRPKTEIAKQLQDYILRNIRVT